MTDSPAPEPVTYTVQQVATLLGRSENSIIADIKRGDLHGKKFGRVYYIPRAPVDSWLKGEAYDLGLEQMRKAPESTHSGAMRSVAD